MTISWIPPAIAQVFEPVEVYTDSWPPYVNDAGQPQGAATRVVEMVLKRLYLQPATQRVDWSLAYDLIQTGKIRLAYPFFKTDARLNEDIEVLYSCESLLDVTNVFYYYKRHDKVNQNTKVETADINVGKVRGFSYGDKLDNLLPRGAIEFSSELLALRSLFSKERDSIDVLPMSEKVGKQLVLKYFPQHYPDFQAITNDKYQSQDSIYLVTVNDEDGQAFIRQFDRVLASLKPTPDNECDYQPLPTSQIRNNNATPAKQSDTEGALRGDLLDEVMLTHLERNQGTGYVRLVAGERHPAIVGEYCSMRAENDEEKEVYCHCLDDDKYVAENLSFKCPSNNVQMDVKYIGIPQGTRALVLEWSQRVAEGRDDENMLEIVSELSLVRIVSGPHFGRELYVKNLHIEVE